VRKIRPIRRVLSIGKSFLKAFRDLLLDGPAGFILRIQSIRLELMDFLVPGFYQRWAEDIEPETNELAAQEDASLRFKYQPLFSIITPVFNPGLDVFRRMVRSILDQTYRNWELCLANGSTDPRVAAVIQDFQKQDPRIRSVSIRNIGIAGNSNAALEIASGEYIVLIDHDDTVSPSLLFEAARVLNDDKSIDIINYDEDKISEDNFRRSPFFKPRVVRIARFFLENILTHCVLRRSLVLEAGRFNPDMDGAQDWDLFFRCIERTDRIVHIPKILYHWRMVPGSASLARSEKPYARAAQKKARRQYIKRLRRGN